MKPINNYMHSPHELQLAQEIAGRLNDPASFNQFLRYAEKYSHKILREKLNKVCSIPENKIRTSRAAYFVFLIEQLDYSDKSNQADTITNYDDQGNDSAWN